MPRTYQRKTDRGLIPEEKLLEALHRVVENQESAQSVAKQLNIPRTSLRRKVKAYKKDKTAPVNSQSYGLSTVFTKRQEALLAEFLEKSSNMFHGLSTKAARQLAFQMGSVNKIKMPKSWTTNEEAGEDWLRLFLGRHPSLSIRRPVATSVARASAFNRHNVNAFFDILENVYLTTKIHQGRDIYNLDESGFTTVQKMAKVIAPKGLKQVGQVTSRERGELVTVCAIVSAAGVALPPVFVFPRKKFQEHMMTNAPEGSLGLVSDNGWMTGEKFLPVLQHFVKYSKPSADNPVILILDNHESHLQYPALEYARKNSIHIVTLVPHTSNKMQPLDRSVFGPVKTFFNERASSWMVRNPGKAITIYNIAELVGAAWIRGARPENIIAGFRTSGIWPLDRYVFTDEDFLPSEVTDRPLPADSHPEPQPSSSGVAYNNPLPTVITPHPESQDTVVAPSSEPQPIVVMPSLEPQPSSSGVTYNLLPTVVAPHPEAQPIVLAPPSELQPTVVTPSLEPEPSSSGVAECSLTTVVAPSPEPQASSSVFISPQQFLGYPKAPPRKESAIGRKRGKCMVATGSPHMKTLQERLNAKKVEPKVKKCKKALAFEDDSDDDTDIATFLGIESGDEDDTDTHDSLTLGAVSQVSLGDYVLCQYDSKRSSVFYVGIVSKEIDEDFDVEVEFLRKNPKMRGKFVKPNIPEIAAVPVDIIKAKLTGAHTFGLTARTQNVYSFNENLDSLNLG